MNSCKPIKKRGDSTQCRYHALHDPLRGRRSESEHRDDVSEHEERRTSQPFLIFPPKREFAPFSVQWTSPTLPPWRGPIASHSE